MEYGIENIVEDRTTSDFNLNIFIVEPFQNNTSKKNLRGSSHIGVLPVRPISFSRSGGVSMS